MLLGIHVGGRWAFELLLAAHIMSAQSALEDLGDPRRN